MQFAATATLEALIQRIHEEYPHDFTQSETTTTGETYIFTPGALYTIIPVSGYGYNVSKLLTEAPTRVGSVVESGSDIIDDEMCARIEASLTL